jgi:hypothetical protein
MHQIADEVNPAEIRRDPFAARRALEQERRFYVIASFVLLLATMVGFREFLMHGKGAGGISIKPQILTVVVVHGIAMLTWVALLLVQSLLIVAGRRRLHMTLGLLGAVLAVAIVILGLTVAPLAARYNPAGYEEFGGARYFLAFSLTAPLMFGALAGIGISYRGRPEVHRPMMLLATVAMMTGSFDRWPYLERLIAFTHGNVPVFHWGPMLLFGAALFALHAAITRRPSRWYAAGYACVVIATLLSTVVASSAVWNEIAARVVP